MKTNRKPITIFSGFLGAGKTTLINALVEQNPNTKFALIENEFAEIGIDSQLVSQKLGSIFEISNGCICCSMNKELTQSIIKMSNDYEFDHLLIETTGIADPSAVVSSLVEDDFVQEHYQINGVICLVDSAFLENQLQETEEAARQIAFADLILLNKKDKITANYLLEVQKMVEKINPLAKILPCEFGNLPENVLEINAYKADSVQKITEKVGHHHHHHHNIHSLSFTFEQDFDFVAFSNLLKILMDFFGKNIYRIKGFISVYQMPERMILQSVMDNFIFQKGNLWAENKPKMSKLVFIGKKLDRNWLENHLKNCLIEP